MSTRTLIAAVALAAAPLVARAQSDSAAPRSAQQLAERYRAAHTRHDVEAIKRLFYWGASTARSRAAVSSFIAQDVLNAVRNVSVVPMDANDRTEYTQDGVTYRMTLPPTAKLWIDFVPRTANGGKYNSEQTTYFIGVRNGEYWLVTAEPSPKR